MNKQPKQLLHYFYIYLNPIDSLSFSPDKDRVQRRNLKYLKKIILHTVLMVYLVLIFQFKTNAISFQAINF